MRVAWQPPASPNGPINGYQVIRRRQSGEGAFEKLIYRGDQASLEYVDNDASLRPYTGYAYRVVVSNEVDETASAWADARTLEDVPEDFRDPEVAAMSAFAVRVRWEAPREPNGRIISYR